MFKIRNKVTGLFLQSGASEYFNTKGAVYKDIGQARCSVTYFIKGVRALGLKNTKLHEYLVKDKLKDLEIIEYKEYISDDLYNFYTTPPVRKKKK